MLKSFSWESYWTFIALSVAIYYIIILFVFRRQGNLQLAGLPKTVWQRKDLKGDRLNDEPLYEESVNTTPENDFLLPPEDSEEYPVYACVDEVNAYLEEAKKRKGNKEELIASIRQIVRKYPSIKDTEYKESLTNLIVSQCEHLCFIHLTAVDMDHVWNG